MALDGFKRYLKSFNLLSDSEVDDFTQLATPKTLRKSDYFIREGETCKRVAFVVSGVLRSYYVSDKCEEITYCIILPNSLLAAYSSYLTALPTHENIQAIAKTELLIIPKEKIEKLAEQKPVWISFLKTIAEQQYLELEKRIVQLQKADAKKRYADMLRDQPEYVQKIPLHHLASYLGITQRHLSRIRREVFLGQLS